MSSLLIFLPVQETLFWKRARRKIVEFLSFNYVMENLGAMVVMEADKSGGSVSWSGDQSSVGQMG